MLDFTYHIPTKVVFGRNSLNALASLIREAGATHVLVHFGGQSAVKSGLIDKVKAQLEEAGVRYTLLGGVAPNPKVSLAREGVALCKREGVDFILAVGGGSVIDSAKCIALGAKMEEDVWNIFERKVRPSEALPIGSVLTIAAAGSEMAGGLVISNDELGLKRDYGTPALRPVFCIENPELTYTVSKWQTACGTVDILMHTFERYFTPTEDVDFTDELCEGLCRSVIKAGSIAYENPTDYEARATLMWASSLSQNDLMGMGRRADWATHQLEHDLSGMYDNVSHGAGLAVIFPAWCRYVMKHNIARFCRFAEKVWGISGEGLTQQQHAEKGVEAAQAYFVSLGMPKDLKAFGVDPDRLPEMAEKCSFNGQRTLGGLHTLNTEDMLHIYRLAYGD
ncbi:MAG: iron-containing alcohol dehydrogenase [Clostridia bacterium]|nr:iron-containing alcohol dehydrogenase [Clostridia bacterium]